MLFRTTKVVYLGTQNNVNLFSHLGSPNLAMTAVVVVAGNVSSNSSMSYAMTMGGANTWPGGTSITMRIAANGSIRGAKGNVGFRGVTANGNPGANGIIGHTGGRALNIDVTKVGANNVLVYIVNEGVIASGNGGIGGTGGGGGGGGWAD